MILAYVSTENPVLNLATTILLAIGWAILGLVFLVLFITLGQCLYQLYTERKLQRQIEQLLQDDEP